MIVLDASVVLELLTNGAMADPIRKELAGRDDSFLVPHLIDIEVVSALRRLAGAQRIDGPDWAAAAATLVRATTGSSQPPVTEYS